MNMKKVKFQIEATQEQPLQALLNSALLSACENGLLPALNRLVELAPDRHQEAYGERYVNPFIRNELTALRAMQTALALENRDAVFNIADEARATRCFHMIRNLIRSNQPASLDDIRFLLAIPAVQALAHTPVTNHEPNELLRLALTTGHAEAAAVLLTIPAVRALAAQRQFYRQEVGGNWI